MKLLTKAVEKSLPPLYSQEHNPDPIAKAHFFNPCGAGDWWITEAGHEGDDYLMFGLCDIGMGYQELGYVSLNELKSIHTKPFGLGIERDMHWTPKPLSEIRKAR